jgi:hypothetical protein
MGVRLMKEDVEEILDECPADQIRILCEKINANTQETLKLIEEIRDVRHALFSRSQQMSKGSFVTLLNIGARPAA